MCRTSWTCSGLLRLMEVSEFKGAQPRSEVKIYFRGSWLASGSSCRYSFWLQYIHFLLQKWGILNIYIHRIQISCCATVICSRLPPSLCARVVR